jgi:hypothetical protein
LKYDKEDQKGKAVFNERNSTQPSKRNSGEEPRWTPNKNRTGHKAEHGQANHFEDIFIFFLGIL